MSSRWEAFSKCPPQRSALQMLAPLAVVFAVTLVARAGKAMSDGAPSVWGRWPGTKAARTLENSLPCWPRTHSPGLTAWGSLAVPDQKAAGPASTPLSAKACQRLPSHPAPSCLPSQRQGQRNNAVSNCSLPAFSLPFLRNSGLDAEAPLVDPGSPQRQSTPRRPVSVRPAPEAQGRGRPASHTGIRGEG